MYIDNDLNYLYFKTLYDETCYTKIINFDYLTNIANNTYDFLKNHNDSIKKTNNEYKNFILNSIENSIKYNFDIFKNIQNVILDDIQVLFHVIEFNVTESNLNTNNLSLNTINFNVKSSFTEMINYFIINLKNKIFNQKDINLNNSFTSNYKIQYIDLINNHLKKYLKKIVDFKSLNLRNYEHDNHYYETLIKQIFFVANKKPQLKIYASNLSVNINENIYIFRNTTSIYVTTLKLVSKTLHDLDENVYLFVCDVVDENLDGLISGYLLSQDISCSTYSEIITIKSDILDIDYFENYKKYKLNYESDKLYIVDYEDDNLSNEITNKYFCLNYNILIYIIYLFNIINTNYTISASGTIINNNGTNTIFQYLFSAYYSYYNIIKNNEYSDTNNNLSSLKLYDNYNFSEFNISISLTKYIVLYQINESKYLFNSEQILHNLLDKLDEINYINTFLLNKELLVNDTKIKIFINNIFNLKKSDGSNYSSSELLKLYINQNLSNDNFLTIHI